MNRAISAAAFLCLVLFLGVLVYRLHLIDLTVVILITLGLAGYDLWLQLYRRRRR